MSYDDIDDIVIEVFDFMADSGYLLSEEEFTRLDDFLSNILDKFVTKERNYN